MKITKYSYELVKVTEGFGMIYMSAPVARVTEPYVLAVRGARAVYEVNADCKIAPVSTTTHQSIGNNGAELDGNYETYATRLTAANTTEAVKTYDYGSVKLLFVSVTYKTSAPQMYIELHASQDGKTWTRVWFGNSTTKTMTSFCTNARYLRWVNKNTDTTATMIVDLYELEVYEVIRSAIVSIPDEFDCIIHEARRTAAADGSRWYALVIRPYDGLAYDYWVYKLKPVKEYNIVTIKSQ